MKNRCGFDHIISLGYNCEVSWRIEDYIRGKIDSYPLSWAYIKNQEELPYILENLELISDSNFDYEERSGMFYCKELNISLHTTLDHSNYLVLSDEEKKRYVLEGESEVRQRFRYLCNKWDKLMQSNESTLFVIKIQNQAGDLRWIYKTKEYLDEKYESGRFKILLVVTNEDLLYKVNLQQNNDYLVLLIKSFAADAETLTGGDRIGWIKGIEYFDHLYDEEVVELSNFVDYKNKEVISKGEFYNLQSWTTNVTKARDWLEDQCRQKDNAINDYEKNIQILRSEIIMKNGNENDERFRQVQKELDEMKMKLKKAEYKLNKLENNEAIKKIIKKKNLYY